AVQDRTLQRNATDAGTTAQALTRGSDVPYHLLTPDSHTQFSSIVGFVMAMLFYMAALGYGMLIATSVVGEKQSRVVEILLSAIPVRQLLFGKLLGNTVLALGQIALVTMVGLVGLTFTDYDSLLPLVAGVAGWFVLFFVVGFFALACIWAVAGSLATRHEDLQSTTAPLTMFLVVVLIASLSLTGVGQVVASYVPVMSTVVMPMRIIAGTAAWWEPILALLVTAAFVAGAVVVGERLFRRSVLQTQGRMGYRQALATRE
ncbi:MAG: ABC transporter permease, partial [Nocardioidaceae bacterium]